MKVDLTVDVLVVMKVVRLENLSVGPKVANLVESKVDWSVGLMAMNLDYQ